MITRSLRWRLLIGAGVAILLALTVAWVVMTLLFERHIERRLTAELTQDASRLVAALTITPEGRLAVTETSADPRLEVPAGGLYWQVSTDRQVFRSRSLWDQALSRPSDALEAAWTLRRATGPHETRVFILERLVKPDTLGPEVLVQFAQDAADLVTARDEFSRELAAFLTLLWLVLTAAAGAQVHLGLQPLSRVRKDLARMHGDSSARLETAWLAEVRPLTEAINDLAEAREADVLRAKSRAADLAHGLKTPLAALAAQSRRIRADGFGDYADALDRSIAALTTTTGAELARSRVAASRQGVASAPHEVVEQILGVLEQTESGERIAFSNTLPVPFSVPVGADDLAEILGPLLENAAKYARRRVSIAALQAPGEYGVTIDDDGPGISGPHEAEATRRGRRLDESQAGQGLGLAIAHEFATAAGGRLDLTRSLLGGLRVALVWSTPVAR